LTDRLGSDAEGGPCINGQVGASGAYFGQDTQSGRIVDRLLGEQLPDGGWNCEAANGSTRLSFNTTICVLDALLEYELAGGMPVEMDEGEGWPNRWVTLRALRVLDWYSARD
jgi:hypothetical protein